MGLIATFTIPKVVTVAQNSDYKTRVQMAAALMVGAYNRYQVDNVVTGTFKAVNLTPYLNYTQFINDSSLTVDGKQNTVQTWTCDGVHPCVRLANGSVISFFQGQIDSVGTSNAIIFIVDPDGKVTDGTTTGPGRAVELYMYVTNGRVADVASIDNPTHCGIDYIPRTTQLPPWFSWN